MNYLLACWSLIPQLVAFASRSPMLASLRLLFAVREVFCLGFQSGSSFLKPSDKLVYDLYLNSRPLYEVNQGRGIWLRIGVAKRVTQQLPQ